MAAGRQCQFQDYSRVQKYEDHPSDEVIDGRSKSGRTREGLAVGLRRRTGAAERPRVPACRSCRATTSSQRPTICEYSEFLIHDQDVDPCRQCARILSRPTPARCQISFGAGRLLVCREQVTPDVKAEAGPRARGRSGARTASRAARWRRDKRRPTQTNARMCPDCGRPLDRETCQSGAPASFRPFRPGAAAARLSRPGAVRSA